MKSLFHFLTLLWFVDDVFPVFCDKDILLL